MKKFILIVGAVLTAIVIFSIAAIAMLGSAVDTAITETEKEMQEGAITQKQFRGIPNGVSIQEVINTLGEPDDRQTTRTKGVRSDCIYYPVAGGEMLENYQFCFTNGRLDSKSRW